MRIFRPLNRALFAAVSSLVIFTPGAAFGLTITVNAGTCTSNVDGAGNVSINCTGSTTPTCSVSVTTAQPVASGGGPVGLTANNCGSSGTWSRSPSAGFAGCNGTTCSDTLPPNSSTGSATYSYTFAGSGSASANVTQSGTGAPPPPPPGQISCSNIPGITSTKVIPLSWSTTAGIVSTRSAGGFGPTEAVVYTFTVPAGATSNGGIGTFSISPSDAAAYNDRKISISDAQCDFSGKLGATSVRVGQEVPLNFSVGGYPKSRWGGEDRTWPTLTAGVTYFVTVIHQNANNVFTCTNSVCNINYGLYKPPGT
jgi:hypothetical protein